MSSKRVQIGALLSGCLALFLPDDDIAFDVHRTLRIKKSYELDSPKDGQFCSDFKKPLLGCCAGGAR